MKNLTAMLAEHPFVRGMKPEHLAVLAEGAKEAVFEPGQIVFRQGDPANRFYLLVDGKLALESHTPGDGEILVQTLGSGEVLGWSWLFAPFVWHFQARAIERTTAFVLDGGHLLVACDLDKKFGFDLMRRVTQVVIHRLQTTRGRLTQTA
jgi:CRP-like cAMP-binding protein